MKILLLHNDYAKYSGEEAVVDKMANMFQAMGHEICFYRPSSKGRRESLIGQIQGFLSGIYSGEGVRALRDILRKEKPDLVNAHNLFPFISPAALVECRKANVPVMMTVHNYRLMCPTGLFMRAGKPCELCLQHSHEWNCIKHNCENSLPKSLGYALRNMAARLMNYYRHNVDYFVCLTSFQKNKLSKAGFNPAKLVVIPNSLSFPDECHFTSGSYIAYVGRLSQEKGVDLFLEVAKRHPEIPFKIAGEIRPEDTWEMPGNVQWVGRLDQARVRNFIQEARFLVQPSRCYEGFPLVILEAASCGKPVIAPNHGGFPEIIGAENQSIGVLFIPANIEDLEHKVVELWNNNKRCQELGKLAFERTKHEYDTAVISQKWINLLSTIPNYTKI